MSGYQYDAAGRRTTALWGSGAKRAWTFDQASQIVSIIDTDGAGALLQRFSFTYDSVGNRTVVRESNKAWTTYAYDPRHAGLTSYVYDAANRFVTSVDGTDKYTYTYDSNGNLTKVVDPTGTTTMSHDKENRLSFHHNAGVTTTYQYEGPGSSGSKSWPELIPPCCRAAAIISAKCSPGNEESILLDYRRDHRREGHRSTTRGLPD